MRFYHQKGVAALEFTILLPLMLLLIYATAEMGRMMHQYNVLTQLTRDAGRYILRAENASPNTTGVVDLTDIVKDKTKNILLYGTETVGTAPLLYGLTAGDISINEIPANTGIIVISVNYNWTPILGDSLPTFGLGNNIDLSFNLVSSYAVGALL